jgi:prophage regulatory protein
MGPITTDLFGYDDLRTKGIRYSKSRLWELERDGRFPKRVNRPRSRLAWVGSEIDGYVTGLVAARDHEALR